MLYQEEDCELIIIINDQVYNLGDENFILGSCYVGTGPRYWVNPFLPT